MLYAKLVCYLHFRQGEKANLLINLPQKTRAKLRRMSNHLIWWGSTFSISTDVVKALLKTLSNLFSTLVVVFCPFPIASYMKGINNFTSTAHPSFLINLSNFLYFQLLKNIKPPDPCSVTVSTLNLTETCLVQALVTK